MIDFNIKFASHFSTFLPPLFKNRHDSDGPFNKNGVNSPDVRKTLFLVNMGAIFRVIYTAHTGLNNIQQQKTF